MSVATLPFPLQSTTCCPFHLSLVLAARAAFHRDLVTTHRLSESHSQWLPHPMNDDDVTLRIMTHVMHPTLPCAVDVAMSCAQLNLGSTVRVPLVE